MPDECRGESRDDRSGVLSQSLTAADPLAAQTKKNKDGLIDALYIFDIEMPDAVSEFIFWYRGDLINHESRKTIGAVAFVRRNRNTKQRRLSWSKLIRVISARTMHRKERLRYEQEA